MPGQAHMPRRRLLPLAALVVVILAAAAVGGAGASRDLHGLHARDAAIAAESRAAVLDLYALDRRLGEAEGRLAQLRRAEASLRDRRATLAHQLAVARRSTHIAQSQLGLRLRQLYEQGTVEPLEIVLGARSLDDALTSIDNLNLAARANRELLQTLHAAQAQLLAAKKALAAQALTVATARRDAEATAAGLLQARGARSAYVASLARERRLTQREIAQVVAQSHAAALRSAALMRARTPAPAPAAGPAATGGGTPDLPAPPLAGGTQLTVSASGYSIHGTTSSGLPTGYGVVAVDPSLIPLGTHMTIPGYGEAVAADTGTAIIGARIDLWFPTLAQARAWGRRTVTITLH